MSAVQERPDERSLAERALVQRLLTVRDVLGVQASSTAAAEPAPPALDLLVDLAEEIGTRSDDAATWLLVVALAGAFPDAALVRTVRRGIELRQGDDAALWLLDVVTPLARKAGNATAPMRVVTDRPLVDVDFTAKHDVLTGIQRVVRGVVGQWYGAQDLELVVWTRRTGAYRALRPAELARLLGRDAGADADAEDEEGGEEADGPLDEPRSSGGKPARNRELVVPWGVPIVLIEVPSEAASDALAALAELTTSSARLVGHDCIPVTSAETVPMAEPEKFGRYLELVKHADRLAGVSRSAAAEFRGFTRALAVQGLSGPSVIACPLPHTERFTADVADLPPPPRPVVVCVGSIGRRKNQAALVEAAEFLWREGLDFELRLLGHLGPERTPLSWLLPELQRRGRHLVVESGVDDARIAATLDQARCLVFPSMHEGFGLPVVEALSHGVPVITSDFGSMREAAEGKGGLLVDPDDVPGLVAALRALLTDDALHARLVAEAAARPERTWDHYAGELWELLVP